MSSWISRSINVRSCRCWCTWVTPLLDRIFRIVPVLILSSVERTCRLCCNTTDRISSLHMVCRQHGTYFLVLLVNLFAFFIFSRRKLLATFSLSRILRGLMDAVGMYGIDLSFLYSFTRLNAIQSHPINGVQTDWISFEMLRYSYVPGHDTYYFSRKIQHMISWAFNFSDSVRIGFFISFL